MFCTRLILSLILLFTLSGPVIAAEKIDINSASAAELASGLNGVGDVLAKRIIEYRNKNGGFSSLDELIEVSGIGPKKLTKNRNRIRIGSSVSGKGAGSMLDAAKSSLLGGNDKSSQTTPSHSSSSRSSGSSTSSSSTSSNRQSTDSSMGSSLR